MGKQETYWLKVLEGEIPVLRLPYDFPRPVIQDFSGGKINFEIGKQETAGLQQLALAQGITLYMVLSAACWYDHMISPEQSKVSGPFPPPV